MKQMKWNLKSKKAKAAIAAVVLLAVTAVAVPRLSMGAEKTPETEVKTSVVEVQRPQSGVINNTDELIGTIEPKDSAYVYPQISGELLSLTVQAGDTVRAGQVLCTIENNSEHTAKSSVDSARVNLEDAKTNLERTQTLYENGGVSQESYEQAQSAYKSAQIQYDSALSTYGDQVGYGQVTAPIGGRVESVDVKEHDNVSPQTQICVIAGGSERIVKFSATETIAKTLSTGDYIKVEKNGSAYDAVISEISTMVNTTTGLFEIKAGVLKGDGLATNASVKVTLISEESTGGLILPLSAVYYDDGNAYVYTYADGLAKKTSVETGMSSEDQVEIISGLTGSDQVIVTWSSSLRDGAPVQLKTSEDGAGAAPDAASGRSEGGTAANQSGAKTAAGQSAAGAAGDSTASGAGADGGAEE